MVYKRYTRKAKRFIKKKVVEPYTATKNQRGFKNRMRLYQEVAAIKKMINAEKKNIDTTTQAVTPFAQRNGASSGAVTFQPLNSAIISQGVTEDTRIGDSIKVCSWAFKFHVESNSFFTLQPTKYTFYIVRCPTNPPASAISDFLENNPFSGVIDYYSNRDYQHFKDFVVMGKVSGTLKANTNNSSNQYQANSHTLAGKANFHIRYDKGTTTVLNNNIYLFAVANDGDTSGTNYIQFQYQMKLYFYDN